MSKHRMTNFITFHFTIPPYGLIHFLQVVLGGMGIANSRVFLTAYR